MAGLLVSGPTVSATSTTASGSAAAATTSAATTARPTAAPAISAPIRTISRRTFSSGHASNCIPIEVWLVVREVSATFDGQRRCARRFAVAFLATVGSRLTTTHLRPLLFEDRLARKPDAITLNRQHLH